MLIEETKRTVKGSFTPAYRDIGDAGDGPGMTWGLSITPEGGTGSAFVLVFLDEKGKARATNGFDAGVVFGREALLELKHDIDTLLKEVAE